MKLYTFSLFDYEGSRVYQYLHAEQKTQEQFLSDVKSLLVKYAPDFFAELAKEEGWAGNGLWCDIALKHMNELGYFRPEYIIIATREDGILKDDHTNWSEFVGSDLLQQAIDYNTDYNSH